MNYTFYRNNISNHFEDSQGLLNYLSAFDPIEYKYKVNNSQLSPVVRAFVSEYESAHQFGSLNKQEYSYIAENLRLVYGNSKLVQDDIRAYHLTEKKIIHSYLGIPQLDKMFDEDYFNFEWDMHVGQNFSEHHNDYYRDHFIHQIRDMYMVLILMEKFGFLDASISSLIDRKNGKIASYLEKKHYAFIHGVSEQIVLLKSLFQHPEMSSSFDVCESEYINQWFFQYVINASAMLSALFHDMGYPICHFLELRHRVSDYNPMMYMFTHNAVDSFDQIASRLGASLLFTIVSTHEIKFSLQVGKNGRYNHGAYSAVAFLLQFYENGMIYTLSPEKQCAIELAAVAIYNHTAKYNVIKNDENNNYYSPVFSQNPVSFLLRFCDDLQEWDRRYFEISEATDLMFCPRCGVPLLRCGEDGNVSNYGCLCTYYKRTVTFTRPDIFIKRKLFLVSVADCVSMNNEETTDGEDGNNQLEVKIEYDLYKLLMLSYINNTYAKYRAKELTELKQILKNQEFSFQSGSKIETNGVRLDYFMSANPILVKIKILERFLCAFYRVDYQKLIDLENGVEYKIVLEDVCSKTGKCNLLYKYLVDGQVLDFYWRLLILCLQYKAGIEKSKHKYLLSSIKKTCFSGKQENTQYTDTLACLMDDCVEQYKKEYYSHPSMEGSTYYLPYTEKHKEALLYRSIAIYTERKNLFNRYTKQQENSLPFISFFTDLQLFYKLNLRTKEIERKKLELSSTSIN